MDLLYTGTIHSTLRMESVPARSSRSWSLRIRAWDVSRRIWSASRSSLLSTIYGGRHSVSSSVQFRRSRHRAAAAACTGRLDPEAWESTMPSCILWGGGGTTRVTAEKKALVFGSTLLHSQPCSARLPGASAHRGSECLWPPRAHTIQGNRTQTTLTTTTSGPNHRQLSAHPSLLAPFPPSQMSGGCQSWQCSPLIECTMNSLHERRRGRPPSVQQVIALHNASPQEQSLWTPGSERTCCGCAVPVTARVRPLAAASLRRM
jgi:hypothetical protein